MWFLGALLALDVVHAQEAPETPTEADMDRARVLFENGRRLYDEGSYEAAIEAWQASYDISKQPGLLSNLSVAHEKLGNVGEALQYLNRYRAIAVLPPAEQDRLARKASTLEIRLREESTAAAALPPPEAPGKSRGGRSGVGTALTVTGGVLAATGAVLGGLALSARGNVNDACIDGADGLTCPASVSDDVQRVEQLGTLSIVALGLGGAGLATGVSLLVSGGDNPGATVEVSWAF